MRIKNSPLLWQYAFPRGKQGQLGAVEMTTIAVFLTDTLILMDAATGRIRRSIALQNGLKTFPVPSGLPPRFLTLRYENTSYVANAPQLLEAWDPQRETPAWSLSAAPWVIVGDGKQVVWSELDQSVGCAEQATGRIQWRLTPEAGGEPFAFIKGRVYLRMAGYKGVAGQFMRVMDAASGRVLGVHPLDPSESSLFRTPQLLFGPNDLAIISETIVGVGLEEYTVRAVDLANDRALWAKGDLQAGGLSGDTLLCMAISRTGAKGSSGLDVRTGRQRWAVTDRSYWFRGVHGSAWVALKTTLGPRISGGALEIVGVRPSDGKVVWSFPLVSGADILDIRLVGDRLIVMHTELSKGGPLSLYVYGLPGIA